MERAKALGHDIQVAEHAQSKAIDKRREAVEAIEKAKANVETAEAEELEIRSLLTNLDAALKAREAKERLAELQDRFAKADATRHHIEKITAELAVLQISAKAIDELQAHEIEIAKLRAVQEAARPTIKAIYEQGATPCITMNGEVLSDAEERGYEGQTQLSILGVGTITLRSNSSTQNSDRVKKAEKERLTLLRSMGVDDLAAARTRQVQAQQKDAELSELNTRLSLLAPEGLPKLREEITARTAASAETLELKDDPVKVRIALTEAEDRRVQAKHALREVEPLEAIAYEALISAKTTIASLTAELLQVDAFLGTDDGRIEREHKLAKSLTDLDIGLTRATTNVDRLRAALADLESAEAALKRVRSVDDAAEKEVNTLRHTIAELNGQIRTSSDEAVEEKWRETSESLAASKSRVEAFSKEVTVLQRLSAALATARTEARELYLKPVMIELRPLLGLLFDDVSITFDEQTLLPQTILRNGQEEDVDRLSGGMREQLSILTRLAFARLLARDGRPAPVILDDALVYSDDDRIERMFNALHRQSRDQQIIVFSCRQRAFSRLGGNVLQMTDWQP